METAGIISLNAVGMQDKMISDLSSNVSQSLMNPSTTQSTYYSKYYTTYHEYSNGVEGWPFGQFVIFELNPKLMGDLLGNMFIKIELDELSDGQWGNHLGRAIFEEIEFMVDNQVIETLDDYMMVARDELFTQERHIRSLNYLINGELDYENNETVLPTTSGKNSSAKNLYIPLPFFFSRYFTKKYSDTPFFPICAINRQKIYLKIRFRSQKWFTNTTTTITCPRVSLVLEEYVLTPIERNYYTKRKFSFVSPIHQKIEKFKISDTNFVKNSETSSQTFVSIFKHKLSTSKPLLVAYWFFRRSNFDLLEDSTNSNVFLNRYNFSSVTNTDIATYSSDELNNQIVKNIELKSELFDVSFIKGESEAVTTAGSIYFRSVNSQSNGMFTPNKNIYSYSFDINPLTSKPDGSENNTIAESKTNLTLYNSFFNTATIQSNTYIFHMYYKVYNLLTFSDGQLVIN